MPAHLIIAHPSPACRKDLSKLFSDKAPTLSIDKVTTGEELERKLSIEPVDAVIVERSLLRDVSLVAEEDVILIVRKPHRTRLLKAVARALAGNEKSRGDKRELTPREQEVQELKDQHLPNKEIAKKLCISEKTVKKHVEHIHQKLAKKR
jgi:DNA-binding CsgD family transcriptional regulator